MPDPSLLPFIMSLGAFVGCLGLIMYRFELVFAGFGLTLLCMLIRSVKEYKGYEIEVRTDS
ncbi:hypothetical protein J2S00_001883 [Caldalkalibacillus uzonensis]|uniref:Uncharacterized protein n=1 Tax=Caldalkalibacillus uzonensis TaxID=353224 RepID=A0ABU0CRP6_9BACI|nr:hypothetical protein [Caldalkalibacillus uzonensis]